MARYAQLAREYALELDGHLVGQGAHYEMGDLSVPRFMGYIWWFFTKNADEQAKAKFRASLWRPPKPDAPIPPQSPWSAESEMKGFAALKAETGA